MLRLDSATVERNSKRFVSVAEGVCAITLNKNEPIDCWSADALSNSFLAVRKCKTAITSSAINASFDYTNIAWSPNLHLRLLQLWVESANFRDRFFEKELVPIIEGSCQIKSLLKYTLHDF